MAQTRREKIVSAPIAAGLVGVFSFVLLYFVAGLGNISGDVMGAPTGMLISAFLTVIVAGAVFGELLSDALEGK